MHYTDGGGNMNIAIVDDEEAFRNTLTELLKRFFRENQQYAQEFSIEEFHAGEELLQGYTPRFDIIFLDIDMAAVNGMETAKRIREVDDMTAIIFVTRMARYALQGYSVAALDFIVKPVDYISFSIKLKRALARVEIERPHLIQVSQNGEMHYINIKDILYIEVFNHYCEFHAKGKNYRIWGSLKEIEQQIHDDTFCLCNRCYLVNLRYVTGIEKNEVLLGGIRLAIGRYKKKTFLEALAKYNGRRR